MSAGESPRARAWTATVLTLFPEMFPGPLGLSLSGKALAQGHWVLEAVDIRDFARDKHATVDDALTFLMNFINVPAGRRALARLKLLQDVGLGYLRLGQPINTLSGGESQRLKLVSHLAETAAADSVANEKIHLTAKNTITVPT